MDLEMLLAVVLGGACGLVLVALVIVLCIRRRRRKDRDQEHRHRKHKAGDVETALMSQPPDVLANKKVTNPLYQRQNSFAEPSGPLDSRPVSQATLVVATDSSALVVTQTIESTADETFGFLIPAPEEAEHGAGSGAGSGAGNSRPTSAASSSAAPAATTTATTSGAGAAAGAAGSTPATTTTAAATPAVSEPPSPTKSVDSAKTPRGSMKHLYMEVLTKAGSPQPAPSPEPETAPVKTAEQEADEKKARTDRMAAIRAARERKKQNEWQMLVQALSVIDTLTEDT
eukprot:m.14179 g.14179  ORF g.14179 m.14179 type:complete len:286 (-) comp4746_c0_seq1:91-948(-)